MSVGWLVARSGVGPKFSTCSSPSKVVIVGCKFCLIQGARLHFHRAGHRGLPVRVHAGKASKRWSYRAKPNTGNNAL